MRLRPVLIALTLAASACSGSSAPSTTASPATTVTTAAPQSTTTTTAATTTTTAATTTSTNPAAALVGTWTGTWNNTTFGSSGPIVAEVSLSGTTMTVDIDLGGNVFGQADPPPETFTIDTAAVAAGGAAVDSEVFGPMTITVTSANTVEMRADAIPNPRLDGIVSTITFGPNGTATGSYEITSGGATFAEGTVEMEKG